MGTSLEARLTAIAFSVSYTHAMFFIFSFKLQIFLLLVLDEMLLVHIPCVRPAKLGFQGRDSSVEIARLLPLR